MNESGNYNAHIQLGSSFEESLINLKRNNMRIDQNLELYRKSILSEFLATTRSDFDIIEKLDFIIEQKLVGLDTDEGSIGFEAIFDEMVCLNRQKEANQYLIDYIEKMQTTESTCRKIKGAYEKRSRR